MKINFLKSKKITAHILLMLLGTSVIPLLLVVLLASGIWSNAIIDRTDELMQSRMSTSQKSLDDYFGILDNVIMRIYTENQYAQWLEKINSFDVSSQLVRRELEQDLQSIIYLHQDMEGIGVYTRKRELIFNDPYTGMSTRSRCFSEDKKEWEATARAAFDHTGTVYSDAVRLGSEADEEAYIIYMGHRLADINNYSKGIKGSMLIALKEDALCQVYAPEGNSKTQFSFLCDRNGKIVSSPEKSCIGIQMWDEMQTKERDRQIEENVVKNHMMDSSSYLVYTAEVCDSQFVQVSIQDRNALLKDMRYIMAIVFLIGGMTILVSALLVLRFAVRIENSIGRIIGAMDRAHDGDYTVQVENKNGYEEFAKISSHFNYMVKQIERSRCQEKDALIREKNAEITALEAQINPHFLYNTLDAINWVAIENEQFQISKMLNNLAVILRYSIQNSTITVSMAEELEYLKKYILLQQQRFDFSFKCFLDIAPELMNCRLHKLLFQPLIENAIVHGFPGKTGDDTIWVSAKRSEDGRLEIQVRDNGKGMSRELTEELNQFDYRSGRIESSIGIRNVIMRVKYYYGDSGDFQICSGENGTEIILWIEYEQEACEGEQE